MSASGRAISAIEADRSVIGHWCGPNGSGRPSGGWQAANESYLCEVGMPINILMPALSPTMEKGNLAKWLKKEGDKVKSGDVIAEIETDKATMEVEAVDEGTIAKIVVPEGTQDVPVNDVIAVLAGDGEDVKAAGAAPQQPKAEAKAEAKPETKAEAPKEKAPAAPAEKAPAPAAAAPAPAKESAPQT